MTPRQRIIRQRRAIAQLQRQLAATRRPPQNPLTGLNRRQMSAILDSQVKGAISPQQAALEQQRQRAIGLSQAMAELNKGIGPATNTMYQGAAQTLGGLTSGYSGAVKAAADAQAAQQAEQLSRLGAPAAQIQQVGAVGQGAENVIQALGALPAGTLAQEGAAFGAAQNMLPASALGRGLEEVAGINQKEQEVLAQVPEIRRQFQNQLIEQELSKAQLQNQTDAQRLYEKQFGLDVTKTAIGAKQDAAKLASDQKKANRDYNLKLKKYRAEVAQAKAEGRRPDATLSSKYGYIVDSNGNPILSKGKRIPVAKTGKDSKTGLSASQLATRRKDAMNDAVEMRGEPMTLSDSPLNATKQGKYIAQPGKSEFKDGSTNNPKNAKHDGEHSFSEAVGIISEKYNVSRTRARSWLIASGWKAPKKKKTYRADSRGSSKPNKTRVQ